MTTAPTPAVPSRAELGPQLSWRRPDAQRVLRFLAEQRSLPFTYDAVGATFATPPPGFDFTHERTFVGRSERCFERACAELRRWRMFDLGWVDVADRGAPIAADTTVGVLARCAGVWALNAARIVRAVDDRQGDTRRFGFAYGTLPGHVECGEERFLILRDERDHEVWFDILSFSRPGPRWARALQPLIRRLQRRFVHDSLKSIWRHAGESHGG